MFGILDREEMKILDEGLKRDGEFELHGHRFKNNANGELFVWENDGWVPIQEAISNAKRELLKMVRDDFTKIFSDSEETKKNKRDESEENKCEDRSFREECDAESGEEELDEVLEEMFKDIVRVTDVSVDDYNVTCTFKGGQKFTAFCHPKDRGVYSLDTGIMVCLLKRLAGGTRQLNEALNQALGVYEEKQKKIEEEKKRLEEEKKKTERKGKKVWDLSFSPAGSITLQFNGFEDVSITDLMTSISDLIKEFRE